MFCSVLCVLHFVADVYGRIVCLFIVSYFKIVFNYKLFGNAY